ncbi:MBL fold metallo-hydrolase [Algibacter miyuki]|uniref:MBL fold metallo-hydrolase n=1 Tax=Algibacter miyuki TaxID=1306933 RepID=A0ABV5GXA4_9FLAO|nr:MBL fold metallo-hydrolase [Algibacter miyuki]MDN3666013.1 MBL fold metallo-hydrolase [Algibacter miyuki]
MSKYYILFFTVFILSCSNKKVLAKNIPEETIIDNTSLVILGTIQDAGSPQIGCKKDCCVNLFKNPDPTRKIVSLGLIDTENNKSYLFEATPDIATQMKMLIKYNKQTEQELADGIFLTHAHIGHYTGLMFLGKEAMNSKNMPVYAMPNMKTFLTENGPWSQLVSNSNIKLELLENEKPVQLSKSISVTPILVPHRDEFSETVGYRISGPNKTALFIPDIDKWAKWNKNITDEIKKVDYAFLDATFYSGQEINNRPISEIAHPFIIESLEQFKSLKKQDRSKVVFIHFNHTNPVINTNSKAHKDVIEQGFKIGKINDVFKL